VKTSSPPLAASIVYTPLLRVVVEELRSRVTKTTERRWQDHPCDARAYIPFDSTTGKADGDRSISQGTQGLRCRPMDAAEAEGKACGWSIC
jgi:hypothetical protein